MAASTTTKKKINEPLELKIGKTLYIISSEHSKTATETIEQKMQKLILQNSRKAAI